MIAVAAVLALAVTLPPKGGSHEIGTGGRHAVGTGGGGRQEIGSTVSDTVEDQGQAPSRDTRPVTAGPHSHR